MSRAIRKSEPIDKFLCEFLSKTANSEELAQYFIDTLGPIGCESLQVCINAFKGVKSKKGAKLAALLGGEEPSDEEKIALEISSLFNYYAWRKQLLAASIGAVQAGELLGISKQSVHERIRDRKLIGVMEGNSMRLPTFQFDPEAPNGCVTGLPEVIREMSGGLISKISWLTLPNAVFNDKKPIDALKAGNFDDVLREARATGIA